MPAEHTLVMDSTRGISPDSAAILSALLEGVLYGFSVLMFMGTIWAMTNNHRMQDVNRPITAVAILLLILSTVHIAVNIIRVQDGLVNYRDTFQGGPVAFFSDVTEKTYIMKHMLYVLQTLLADGVMIYRCYVIWRRICVIILPSILWCCVAVTGISGVYSLSQARNSTDLLTTLLADWVPEFIISALLTNLLSSGLLAYHIWMTERSVSTVRATRGSIWPIVRILVDAAILYSAALFARLICVIYNNNGEEVLVDMTMPIISIAFYMVLIRVVINGKTCSSLPTEVDTEQKNSQKNLPTKPLPIYTSRFTRDDSTLYRIGSVDSLWTREGEPVKGALCNV